MSLFKALRGLGHAVVVHREVAGVFGLQEGHFLEQIAYWMERTKPEAEEWVYKTSDEIEKEICLTYKQQIRIREKLVDLKVLEERQDRVNHVIFFRVNAAIFDSLMAEGVSDQRSGTSTLLKVRDSSDQRSEGTLPKVSSYKGTEITQEITAESAAPEPGAVCTACGLYGIHACKGRPRKHKEPRQRFQKERPYVQEVPKRSSGEGRAEASRRAIEVSCRPGGVAEKALRAAEEGGY